MRSNSLLATLLLVLALMSLLVVGASGQATDDSEIFYLPRENGLLAKRSCQVHKLAMQVEVVELRYGLIRPYAGEDPYQDLLRSYIAAKGLYFPETHHWEDGGCVVRHRRTEVYFCKACRNDEVDWHRSNPGIHSKDLTP